MSYTKPLSSSIMKTHIKTIAILLTILSPLIITPIFLKGIDLSIGGKVSVTIGIYILLMLLGVAYGVIHNEVKK